MPKFTAPDGAQLHFTDEGSGISVLALSGLSRNGSDFNYLAPHLPSGVRFIRMDYRGRGQSDWTGADTYTIPTEAGDVLALLDHLGLAKAAILGTSRGGLIAMGMATFAKDRLNGACLVDIGPELAPAGMETIRDYIGKNPPQKTYAEASAMRASLIAGFDDVPGSRWDEEVRLHYIETPDGLQINYDPALRDAVLATAEADLPDLWPMFDALSDLPLALVRGANSELLAKTTADEMARRRPDMLRVDVPGRGHVPFLDEPEALDIIHRWIGQLT
jgi:pimeloyl-ACP methyl ester carboxylesterase